MEYALAVVLLLALVALLVSAPFRARKEAGGDPGELREDLEAEKEARYREIREAELDHRTGKLSDADWERIDRELRAEAIEILRKIDELG